MPDFRGRQALEAWLRGHDLGLLCQGPDPDSPQPLLHGRVVGQHPQAGTVLHRWDVVTLQLAEHGDPAGVREPRRPLPLERNSRGVKPLPAG